MKTKSENNLNAAQRIIDANNGSICFASIHCSYYSVFQYMKYILASLSLHPYTYEQQDASVDSGSHERIFREIRNRFSMSPKDEKDFVNSFNLLKKQRKLADYTSDTFTVEECIEAKQQAVTLRNILTSQFNKKIS